MLKLKKITEIARRVCTVITAAAILLQSASGMAASIWDGYYEDVNKTLSLLNYSFTAPTLTPFTKYF